MADPAGQRLHSDVGDAEEDAGRGTEQHAVVLVRHAQRREEHEDGPGEEQPRLECDHPGERVARVRSAGRRNGDREQRQAGADAANADPLAPADLESEDALGEHGEEHQPAGHDRLDQRQRRQRHRADVEQPGAE